MDYRYLGRTGVRVSELCLGAMMFGAWGNTDHDDCIRIVHAALDAGINFVDTADVYSDGESEEILAKALRGRRDDIVLATKCHNPMGDELNHQGSSRRWIIRSCEDSLRRLDTDYIDLYQIHRLDTHADHDETLGALSDLVHAGKVRYLGSSTYPTSAIVEAQWVAERRGRERFVCEQPPYSLLYRGIESDMLPTCRPLRHGRHVLGPARRRLALGPLAQGRRRDGELPGRPDPHPLRPHQAGEPAQARRGGGVQPPRRGDRDLADPPRARVRGQPPGGHVGDHRAPHDGALREPDRRGRRAASSADVLDRIDKIVPPGTDINSWDSGWLAPAIIDKRLRRR